MTSAQVTSPDFEVWFEHLWKRHTRDLTFQQIRKSVQSISRSYVQERHRRLDSVFETAGKRAAFALYYGPLHFLLVDTLCRRLGASWAPIDRVIDLGCGSGASGAAWARASFQRPELVGVDRKPWARSEAAWTYRRLGLRGRTRSGDITRVALPGRGTGIIVAFTANELDRTQRERLQARLLDAASRGACVLIVEPISRRLTPWWDDWTRCFEPVGGRADQWRFSIGLPEGLRLLDKASRLDHSELTGRSLWLARSGSQLSVSKPEGD